DRVESSLDLAGRRWRDPTYLRSEHNLHPVLFQDLPHRFGDVRVLPDQELIGALDDRDLTAEAAEELAELQRDVSTADDEEGPRDAIELHDRGRIKGSDAVEAGDRRFRRTRPG